MKDTDLYQLVLRIKDSDHGAFEEVFNEFHQPVYQFLLYKTKDAGAAEDLLQDVFVSVWNARQRLDVSRSFKNYLYTTAANLALNHIRHNAVVFRHSQESPMRILACTTDPHFQMEEAEWARKIGAAIEDLPDTTREIFLMSRMEDLTYKEIADRLALSEKVVEAHIVKALRILRTRLPFKL